jgi:hypothetical protein
VDPKEKYDLLLLDMTICASQCAKLVFDVYNFNGCTGHTAYMETLFFGL